MERPIRLNRHLHVGSTAAEQARRQAAAVEWSEAEKRPRPISKEMKPIKQIVSTAAASSASVRPSVQGQSEEEEDGDATGMLRVCQQNRSSLGGDGERVTSRQDKLRGSRHSASANDRASGERERERRAGMARGIMQKGKKC